MIAESADNDQAMAIFYPPLRLSFFTALVAFCALAWSAAAEEPMYVQVRATVLRADPKLWGAQVSELRYGDRVEPVGQATRGWLEVRSAGRRGFLPLSTVTSKRVVLSGGGEVSSSADLSRVVLAGKGFNREVEAEFAAERGIDLKAVDQCQRLSAVTPSELARFAAEGGLGG